ncbi:MAG TPA: branched-chain amino acid transaminase [Nitrospiria bacterium]|nr:branched-chain amino acid transaminase [Candidatus Manganitrophaceae bacterium]HIL34263.1 branched-chain amino acid transaminase [Candidatus Manganitrophaceae bacterium]
MIKSTSSIWMDGKLVPWEEAKVHVLTHTLHYGLGVFEGIRCYKGDAGTAIFRLQEHAARLLRSAHVVQMKIPFSQKEIEDAVIETVRKNRLEEGYIRPLAFIGYGEMGLYAKDAPIHLSIAVWPWGTYLGDEGLKRGIRVSVSSFTRHHVNISLTRAKVTGYYVNSQLAKREAKEAGFDEAVLLDTDGYVTEGPGENIFIVQNGTLRTTPMTSSILEGITRETILQLARERDIKITEGRFTRDDLYLADEAFFTGTAAEVTPIREVDGRTIGTGKPGSVTLALQTAFFDIVRGKSDEHPEWLTSV